MERRDFFKQLTSTALAPSPIGKGRGLGETPTTGLNQYKGTWGHTQAIHLLRRTIFGVKQSELEAFKAMTMSNAVDALLNVSTTAPAPPVNAYNNGTSIDPDVPAGQTWVNAPISPNYSFQRRRSIKSWWTGLMINQETTILEKMVMFWHNHFATEGETIQVEHYMYKNIVLCRQHALGNFKTLVKEMTIDPGMLRYLNGYLNTKSAPDENYARELQELFTLGKGKDSKYTEDDVKAAAKVLTGWRINNTTLSSYFDSNKHDTGNKTFSSFFNNTVITGKTGTNGANETDELLAMIFLQNEVAKFMCRKLYRYFVYYDIDATVETNVIVPLATIFRNNNYDIKPVLATLLKSEHFYDTLSMGCSIKSPLEYAVGFCRQFEVSFPVSTDYVNNYNHWAYLQAVGAAMQQDSGDPPNVAGWPAYYQEPQYYEIWINSDTLPKRMGLATLLIYTGYNRGGFKLIVDVLAFAAKIPNTSDPNKLIDNLLLLLMPVAVDASVKPILKSALLNGQSTDSYWTDAWNAYKANNNDLVNKNYWTNQLRLAITYILNLAEFQLN
ncbi:MAG: DUF1800 family protein [Bacteroidia bacterium]